MSGTHCTSVKAKYFKVVNFCQYTVCIYVSGGFLLVLSADFEETVSSVLSAVVERVYICRS